MLIISDLKPAKGSIKKKKRVARGTSSGHGRTSCRGHKGQRSRAGGTKGKRFEGGQTPLYRRLPKIGKFKNYPFKIAFNILNIEDLEKFEDGSKVDIETLKQKFFSASKKNLILPIKVLGKGKLTKKITVEAHKFSEDALKMIESAGGRAVVIEK